MPRGCQTPPGTGNSLCLFLPRGPTESQKSRGRLLPLSDPLSRQSMTTWAGLTSSTYLYVFQVYLILACQLLVTTAIVAIFTFVRPVTDFVHRYPAVYWVSYAVYFITHIVLVCCKGPRGLCCFQLYKTKYVHFSLQTLALSYMTGSISSYYNTKAVFLAVGITAVVCIAVTVFCFQTKVDFTKCQGLFCVLGIVMFVTGIITAIVYFPENFLAYHTQLLIGNRKHSISEEEYVFAALSIYVDIVQIFLFLLQIIGASTK
uniref:Transmembrane BAX inhibitor motif containing 1a n=1 Tax=Acanthochromis polyacanthus TaxID=80966 RepID=A0A3Q1EV60_9TELE